MDKIPFFVLVEILSHTDNMLAVKLVCRVWCRAANTDTFYNRQLERFTRAQETRLGVSKINTKLTKTLWPTLTWKELFAMRGKLCLISGDIREQHADTEVMYLKTTTVQYAASKRRVISYKHSKPDAVYTIFSNRCCLGWFRFVESGWGKYATYRGAKNSTGRFHGKMLIQCGRKIIYVNYVNGHPHGLCVIVSANSVRIIKFIRGKQNKVSTIWTSRFIFHGIFENMRPAFGTFHRADGVWEGRWEAPYFWGTHDGVFGEFVNWM